MRFVSIAIVGLLAVHAEAEACDRALSPLEVPEVGAAVADLVVSGEVTAIVDGVASVKVGKVLKGAAQVGDVVQLRGASFADDMSRCGGLGVEVGKQFTFLLWAPAGQLGAHHVIDPHAGVLDIAQEQKLRDALAKGHPHSPWRVKGDVATMLVLDPHFGSKPANADDVDVFVVLRNIGAKPKPYRFAAWPRQTQTKCTLGIVNIETKKTVAAKPVPIAQKDISTYFKRNDRKWETTIAAGSAQLLRLFRITTAKQGWGYKEELGFVYYPIAKPGAHAVSAECWNVFGVGTRVATEAVTLTL